jgi:hypothetical protein
MEAHTIYIYQKKLIYVTYLRTSPNAPPPSSKPIWISSQHKSKQLFCDINLEEIIIAKNKIKRIINCSDDDDEEKLLEEEKEPTKKKPKKKQNKNY